MEISTNRIEIIKSINLDNLIKVGFFDVRGIYFTSWEKRCPNKNHGLAMASYMVYEVAFFNIKPRKNICVTKKEIEEYAHFNWTDVKQKIISSKKYLKKS